MKVHPRLMNLLLNEGNIPGRVRGQRLLDFKPTRDQRKAYAASCNFVTSLRDHYVSPHRPLDEYPEDRELIGVGLLFTGPPGTGKTTLASLLVQEIFMTYRLPVFFAPFSEYLQSQIDIIRAEKNDDPEQWAALDLYKRKCYDIPVLALDDVGKEHFVKGSTFARDELDRIVRYRYRHMKPTIITTNIKEPEWATTYGESMESFLYEAYDKYRWAGEDLRGER